MHELAPLAVRRAFRLARRGQDVPADLRPVVVGASVPGLVKVAPAPVRDRKSTRLNSSHGYISYAVFCLKKKKKPKTQPLKTHPGLSGSSTLIQSIYVC